MKTETAAAPPSIDARAEPRLPLGATLRDELAMAALPGLMNGLTSVQIDSRIRRRITMHAYLWADAMLEARAVPVDQLPDLLNGSR